MREEAAGAMRALQGRSFGAGGAGGCGWVLQKELLLPGERGRAGVLPGKMEAGGRER